MLDGVHRVSPVATEELYEGKVRRQAGIFRPNITGRFSKLAQAFDGDTATSGAFTWSFIGNNVMGNESSDSGGDVYFYADRCSSVYKNDFGNKIQVPAVQVLVAIRY